VPLLSGFTFDAAAGQLGFRPLVRSGDRFGSLWSGPNAWGTIEITEGVAMLRVLGGELVLATLGLPLGGADPVSVELGGRRIEAVAAGDAIRLDAPLRLGAGAAVTVRSAALTVGGLPDTRDLERAAREPRAVAEDGVHHGAMAAAAAAAR